jgi:hypothetical protein
LYIQQLYELAVDFVQLPDQFKYAIAEDLNLIDNNGGDDVLFAEIEDLEERIWMNVIHDDLLADFMMLVGQYGNRGA